MSAPLDFPRPLTSVDVTIFAILDATLQVLLMQRSAEPFARCWALPGGFVNIAQDASLEACALRKLKEKTGVDAAYLEQLGSWGDATRDPRGWSTTHVYFALMAADEVSLRPGGNAQDTRWSAVDGLRYKDRLAFDHSDILKAAIARLRNKVEYTSLPAFLMPKEFTLTELQQTYEALLGRPLEKKSFRTRVLATDLLEEIDRHKQGPNRPAQLYRLKNRRRPIYFARALTP